MPHKTPGEYKRYIVPPEKMLEWLMENDISPPYDLSDLTKTPTTLYGLPLQQTWSALFMLERFIHETRIKRIVELGTGNGALTQFFMQHCPTMSWDIVKKSNHGYVGDVFDPRVIKAVDDWIVNHKSLIFCDDGDKPRELATYAPILYDGDYIMVHDYRRPDGIYWSDVLHSMQEVEGLDTYRQDEFDALKTYILSLRKTI